MLRVLQQVTMPIDNFNISVSWKARNFLLMNSVAKLFNDKISFCNWPQNVFWERLCRFLSI
jgi:hypothetical protein